MLGRASSMLESKCLDREVLVEAAGGVPVVGVDKEGGRDMT